MVSTEIFSAHIPGPLNENLSRRELCRIPPILEGRSSDQGQPATPLIFGSHPWIRHLLAREWQTGRALSPGIKTLPWSRRCDRVTFELENPDQQLWPHRSTVDFVSSHGQKLKRLHDAGSPRRQQRDQGYKPVGETDFPLRFFFPCQSDFPLLSYLSRPCCFKVKPCA